jgi:Cys-tRNA(Pro)/Cys-tRNA(Cys) deacylase
MKKDYPVFLEETASLFESIFVSGGKIGLQIELDPEDLLRTASGRYADLITD